MRDGSRALDTLADDLIEDDRAYFELGATLTELTGATLATMPHHAGLASGAVTHRVRPNEVVAAGPSWVDAAMASLACAGGSHLRVYLDRADTGLASMFRSRRLVARRELGFAAVAPLSPGPIDLDLRGVSTECGWRDKLTVQRASDPPDGHGDHPQGFIALERAKSAHGLEPWVAYADGEPVGAACTQVTGRVLRNKNLVVAASWRRRGVASTILAHFDRRAREAGLVLGTFAVAESSGEALYRSLGMRRVCEQVEWSKPLGRR